MGEWAIIILFPRISISPQQYNLNKHKKIRSSRNKMRSRVSDVKIDFKGKYETFECEISMKKNHKNIYYSVKI